MGILNRKKGLLIANMFVAATLPTLSQQKPNVIVLLTDDQGFGDFSCNGNPILKTPNLDKLHDESVSFSNFHVAPVSTPTRGQLLTGMDAIHNKACMVPAGRNLMQRDIPTMPQIFKDNGYQTGIFGKWHLGDNYPDRPMDRGFDKCVWFKGFGLSSEAEYDNDYYQVRYLDGTKTNFSMKYCTDFWFDEAMSWMTEMSKNKQPFFTYLATNTPHGPFFAPEEDYNFYKQQGLDNNTSAFFGMIRNIDKNVEKLDQWLIKNKLKENTIIVVMNDNGGTGGLKVYNANMRGGKGVDYDGGHRASCFFLWPAGKLGKPRTVNEAAQIQDLLPTFIDMIGLKQPTNTDFDGKSLKPLLKDTKNNLNERMLVVQYGGRQKPMKYKGCVVWKSWRLVAGNELYDVSNDPGQVKNVASANPDILKNMKSYYEQWWAKLAAGIDELIPVVVGSKVENPVVLTSNNWIGDDVDNRVRIAEGAGAPRGGYFLLDVAQSGKYLVKLSRWPFHLNRQLTVAGPEQAIGGTKLLPGKALPISKGNITLNKDNVITLNVIPEAKFIEVELPLTKGRNTLQAWFSDQTGKDLCGAYYVSLERKD